MALARAAGERLAAIGRRYGVSRERVRQITKALGVAKPPSSVSAKHLRWATKRELAKLFTGTAFDRAEVLRLTGWRDEGTDLDLCRRLYNDFRLIRCGAYVRCSRCDTFKPIVEHHPGYMNTHAGLICHACGAARARKWYETHDWPKPGPKQPLYSKRAQLKKAGRIDEMPPLDAPYTPKPFREGMRQYWAKMDPAQKTARIQHTASRAKEGWQAWRDSLTPEQYEEWKRRVRVGAAAGRAANAAKRHGGAA